MPMYSVQCPVCAECSSVRLSFGAYDQVKAAQKQLACQKPGCTGVLGLLFDPGRVAFVLKDGESGGWASKAGKENAYRAQRRVEMSRRERDHVFKSRLQPNFQGQLTPTWQDAKDVAYQARYDAIKQEQGGLVAQKAAAEAAASYDPLVKTEISR